MKHAKTEPGNRAKRTLIQGAVILGAIAVLGVLISALSGAKPEELLSPQFWGPVGLLAAQAGGMAIFAYIQKWLEDHKPSGAEDV